MVLQKLIAVVALLILSGCMLPKVEAPKPPVDTRAEVLKIADSSACLAYSWKNRGRAPRAYIRGMALAYAAQLSSPNKFMAGASGNAATDALAHYGVAVTEGREALRTTWTLLIGLGMRESSGKHCCGKDASADNTTASGAEAGALQASYNSMSNPYMAGGKEAQAVLSGIYAKHKAGAAPCDLDVWSDGVKCGPDDWKNWGVGEGVTFQKLSKECPRFSAEYNATLIRVLRKHHGPLNRKEAEYRPECEAMLKQIEAVK